MSFGFSIGDIKAVSTLAWDLYKKCYIVARGAPQEFQLLVGEISGLSNSLKVLQEELADPKSTLIRAGEDRVRMVNEMMSRVHTTLKDLEKVAKKYEALGTGSKSKHMWMKFKWSVEFSSIDSLRSKVLLLTPLVLRYDNVRLTFAVDIPQHCDESTIDICRQVCSSQFASTFLLRELDN